MRVLAMATTVLVALATAAIGKPTAVFAADLQRLSGRSPFNPGGSHACSQDDLNPFGKPDLEIEPSVAVDPSDDERIAVAWPQDNALGIVVASSRDGGGSWHRVVLDGFTTCTGSDKARVSHPRLSFAPDGSLYLAAFPVGEWFPDPRNVINEILVSRSDDGGVTWSHPRLVTQAETLNDFDGMVTEPDTGAVDVIWAENEGADQEGEPIYLSRSTDGARTWTKTLVARAEPQTIGFTKVAALPGGQLLVFSQEVGFSDFFPEGHGAISVRRSKTKGRTWSAPVNVVGDAINEWPSVAVTRKGRVYLAYRTRSEGGAFAIWITRSDDAARTWTDPVRAFTYRFSGGALPNIALAVSGERTLGVLHFTSVDDPGRLPFSPEPRQARIALSSDCGRTWMSESLGQPFTFADAGFAQGLAATPHGFLAAVSLGGEPGLVGPTDIFLGSVRGSGAQGGSCNESV